MTRDRRSMGVTPWLSTLGFAALVLVASLVAIPGESTGGSGIISVFTLNYISVFTLSHLSAYAILTVLCVRSLTARERRSTTRLDGESTTQLDGEHRSRSDGSTGRESRGGVPYRRLLLAVAIATGFGAGIELVQATIPWRTGSLVDVFINGVGAVIGALSVLGTAGVRNRDSRDRE